MKKKILSLVLALSAVTGVLSGCGEKQQTGEAVTIDFMSVWQGDSATMPDDPVNNLIAQKIKEETGVTINVLTNNSSETERLNILFSSGELPDIISAPMWGGGDASTQMLKKAAKEGLLMPLDDLGWKRELIPIQPTLRVAMPERPMNSSFT